MRLFLRSSLTVALPFILVWAFSVELFRGIKGAFRSAWLEVRIELSSFRDLWRNAGA